MKKTLFFAIVAIFALASCTDEIKEMKILIEGSVTDAKTGAVLEGVEVSLTNKGDVDTVTTDENGYFELGQYNPGSYTLIVSKDGYLTSSVNVSSHSMFSTMNTVSPNEYVTVNLSPLSGELNMTVFKRFSGSATKTVAAEVPYTIYLNNYNDPIKGTTDENGLIQESNFPAGDYLIEVDFEVGDYRYKSTSNIDADFTTFIIVWGYNTQGKFGLVSSNLLNDMGRGVNDFRVNGDIELVFNQPIDTTNGYSISYMGSWQGYYIDLSNGNMKVTIDPDETLDWETNYNFSFTFENATFTDTYSDNISFKTEEE